MPDDLESVNEPQLQENLRPLRPASEIKTEDQKSTSAIAAYMHSGPLPDAHTLQAYKDIDPRLFDAVLEEFQANGRHRRDMERIVKEAGALRQRSGLFASAGLGSIALIGSIILGAIGKTEIAATLLGAPLLTFLGTFLYASYSGRNERLEKEKMRLIQSDNSHDHDQEGPSK